MGPEGIVAKFLEFEILGTGGSPIRLHHRADVVAPVQSEGGVPQRLVLAGPRAEAARAEAHVVVAQQLLT